MARRLSIAAAVVVVLGVSFVLAGVLTQDNRLRGALADLLEAQAAGDVPAMRDQVEGCAGGCDALAARMRRPGEVKLVRVDESGDVVRVVWTTQRPEGVPTVQCVRVRHERVGLVRRSTTLLRLSAPIANEAGC